MGYCKTLHGFLGEDLLLSQFYSAVCFWPNGSGLPLDGLTPDENFQLSNHPSNKSIKPVILSISLFFYSHLVDFTSGQV